MRIPSLAYLPFLLFGCGNSGAPADAAVDLMQPIGVAMEATCTDGIDSIYAAQGTLPAEGGAILKCAKDQDLPRADLQAMLDAHHFMSRAVDGGAHLYRVTFKTERGTTPAISAASSALVLLPDTPRAAQLPVVVLNHATRGESANCAASKLDPSDDSVNDDFVRAAYSLAGYGYAVIAPDNAGFVVWNAPGNPLPGFLNGTDEAKSALDGAKALRKLIPSSLTTQVVLVGHSQGGHTALAALAMADSYGSGGTLAAVAVESPLWLPIRSFGALIALGSSYPFASQPDLNMYTIWYHYAASELVDGQGHGVDIFAAAKRAGVKDLVETICFPPATIDKLNALGTSLNDIIDPTFANSVPNVAAGIQTSCAAGDALCAKWMQRYFDDRPHLTGNAKTVPILLAWGSADTTIGFDRITCAIDRLKSDGANLEPLCVDPGVDHGGITGTRADVVADWIAQKTLGGPAPAACPASTVTDPMGQPATCSALPPNTP